MDLDFRGWFEARRAATVHPEVKKWIDSADKLKQAVEKIKALMKDKEQPPKKTDFSAVRSIDFEKLQSKFKPKEEPKEDKPETKDKPEVKDKSETKDKPESKTKIEPKNIEKPTKVEKDEEKGSQNDRQNKRLDLQRGRTSP